jgi:hypothetical protein
VIERIINHQIQIILATIIKKKKKVSVSTTKGSTKTVATIIPAKIRINQTFTLIKQIKARFGASIPPRKCFGFMVRNGIKTNIAVWCPSYDPGTPWTNILTNGGRTLIEKKRTTLSFSDFQKLIRKEPNYDVNILRMVFLKVNKKYHFIGFFQVDVIDFTMRTVTFKKVDVPTFVVAFKRKKITVTVEEETVESTLLFQP